MASFGTATTDTAWNVLGHVGALQPVVYTVIPAPQRNLIGGQTTGAGATYTLDMLVRGYRRNEVDGVSVVAGDMLARVPQTLLPVTPNTRHTLTVAGVVWNVVAVTEGANGGWWRLQIRRPHPV